MKVSRVSSTTTSSTASLWFPDMDNTVIFTCGGRDYPRKGFIFDFDGVVVDTETYHYRSWLAAAELSACTLDPVEYLPLKSTGNTIIANYILEHSGKAVTEEAARTIFTDKERIFRQIIQDLSEKDILPGIPAFLSFLKARGVKMAVASSSHATCELAARFGLDEFFPVIIDGKTKLPRKPQPDTFLLAAKLLDVDPSDCIVFEDSLAGIGAGVNAKMPVVAIGGIQSPDAVLHLQDFSQFDRYFR